MLNPGDILRGSYEILGPLGQGASGDVFKARHVHMGHCVAIKMLQHPPADPQEWPKLQSQFLAEALLLRDHSHPNLPGVTDFFEERQTAFMVMDFIDGENLESKVLREGPVPEATVLEWVRQICSVLNHLHHELPTPIVHRDFKPQNLILSQGKVFVVDFGIAKVGDSSAPTKTLLRFRGTPPYCPLEQYHGRTDTRSDYYALGATMYHLLSGDLPPEATERATHRADLRKPPHVSARTWGAIQGLMEVQPDDRPANVAEVRRLLVTKTWLEFLQENRHLMDSPYEVEFVEKCLSHVPVDFQFVQAQTPFQDSRGKPRRMDFSICEPQSASIAIELDGWDKTGRGGGMTREEFADFNLRQASMVCQNWTLLRFANDTLIREPDEIVHHLLTALQNARSTPPGSGVRPIHHAPPTPPTTAPVPTPVVRTRAPPHQVPPPAASPPLVTVPSVAPRATPSQVLPPSVTAPTQPVPALAPPPPPSKRDQTTTQTWRIVIVVVIALAIVSLLFIHMLMPGDTTGEPPQPPVTPPPSPTIHETKPPLPGTPETKPSLPGTPEAEPPHSVRRTGKPTSTGTRTSDPPLPGTQRKPSDDIHTNPTPSDNDRLPGTPFH